MVSFEQPGLKAQTELVINVDGYSGPLDVLLKLAQMQKVDLANISVLALCEQYLAFVEKGEALRLELAADYLVMAAWLVYLKSRLLLASSRPEEKTESPDEIASQLRFRLMRLEAMRDCAERMMRRALLGRDVFSRGVPEAVIADEAREYDVSLYDFLRAWGEHRMRKAAHPWSRPPLKVIPLDAARELLQQALGRWKPDHGDWVEFQAVLGQCSFQLAIPPRSRLASVFGAVLALAREERVEFRQQRTFGTIHLRRRRPQGGEARQ